jgi:UDP-glucose 4-epimerase
MINFLLKTGEKAMKCLVTGGAGFIGSHLVDRLMDNGHYVTVFDNMSVGKVEFLSRHIQNDKFKLIQGDLLNLDLIKKIFSGHDIIFHLAANPEARLGIKNTDLDLKQETIVTYNVLEAMRKNNIQKIIFSSSGTIYGETPFIPIPENYGPAFPISLYGAGKLASEGLISAFCGTFGMQAWIYRFANIVGPRATHGVIYDFICKLKRNSSDLEILGDGKQSKPYLYVVECVEGILFGLENASEKINVYNLGCTSTTNVNTIAQILIEEMELTCVNFKYSGGSRGWPGDVPQFRCDTRKATALGWKAKYSSNEAVRKAIRGILGKE